MQDYIEKLLVPLIYIQTHLDGELSYADFLEEAATVLPNLGLAEAADQYKALGQQWSAFADTVLPDTVKPLAETRQLLARKYALFLEYGNERDKELAAINQQLSDMEEELNPSFPLSDSDMKALFAQMQDDLYSLCESEVAALDTLKGCLN